MYKGSPKWCIFVKTHMDKELQQVDRLLKALADPTRLRMLGLLRGGEVCVCHIHDSLKIPQPKASRHLAYLRRAGVVNAEKRGLWVYYSLAPQANPVVQTLLDSAVHCVAHVATARRDAHRLQGETGCCLPVAESIGFACCASPSKA